MFSTQNKRSFLFITLDSCRFDTFVNADIPRLKAIGPLFKAMAPGYFTYGSHAAMFMGFTPGIAELPEPFVNPKFCKILKITGTGFPGKGTEYIKLTGKDIINGFKNQGYRTLGTSGVGWFDVNTASGKQLTQDFDDFYFTGNTASLANQLTWLSAQLQKTSDPTFVFINIGETHVPYYFEGAPWDKNNNPCIPFSETNDAAECSKRQKACLEYIDQTISGLLEAFASSSILICSDHGDCWGEDGLWEHGFHHERVLTVPLLFRLARIPGTH